MDVTQTATAQGGNDPAGGAPPVEQKPFLQDQTLGKARIPDCNFITFLLKQGELR